MRYVPRITPVTLMLLMLPFIFPFFAAAQSNSEGITIAPAIVEDRAEPGETYHFSLTVTNTSDAEQTYYLGAHDITGLDATGKPVFSEEQEKSEYELSSWIRVPESPISLAAGESRTVAFTVQVPTDASPGSHFGGIFFDRRPPELQEGTSGTGIGFRVGNVISLRIAGDVTEIVQLHEFSTDKLVYSVPDVTFRTKIANAGNLLERPRGFIEISDMRGRSLANIAVNENGSPVFPRDERTYESHWQTEDFSIGRYQAIASIIYGVDGKQTITATTSFWILPLKLIGTVFAALFGAVLFVYLLVRIYIRRKLKEMGVSGRGGDINFYAHRYQRSGSKLLLLLVILLLVAVALLAALFVVFA